jgi:hypothetical protein
LRGPDEIGERGHGAIRRRTAYLIGAASFALWVAPLRLTPPVPTGWRNRRPALVYRASACLFPISQPASWPVSIDAALPPLRYGWPRAVDAGCPHRVTESPPRISLPCPDLFVSYFATDELARLNRRGAPFAPLPFIGSKTGRTRGAASGPAVRCCGYIRGEVADRSSFNLQGRPLVHEEFVTKHFKSRVRAIFVAVCNNSDIRGKQGAVRLTPCPQRCGAALRTAVVVIVLSAAALIPKALLADSWGIERSRYRGGSGALA